MSIIEIEKPEFIVINMKRISELDRCSPVGRIHPAIMKLLNAVVNFEVSYEAEVGKKMNQTYWVCNQDEPYANTVIETILHGEKQKEQTRRAR